MIAHSDAQGFDRHTWQMVWTAFVLIDRIGPWRDWVWALGAAERAAARSREHGCAARLTYFEGVATARLGNYELAQRRFAASQRVYAELGDVPGQVRVLIGVAWTWILLDRPRDSLKVAQAALKLQRGDAGATAELIAEALRQVAEGFLAAGEYEKALECCAEMETLLKGVEVHSYGSGHDALTKGAILVRLGEFNEAIEVLASAIRHFNQFGSWSDIAGVQRWLGEAYEQAGDLTAARRTWFEALATLEYHQHPFAEKVRAKLAALPEN
ncbi:hypothetical protein UK23_03290 [Lentzea aerocolonigenes]|uniref:MalT-like TPR region domain-containing protein n=1 Tax=Lentzea aerocolonigenes TaxID=68170 RepID=A0A0F0HEE5_LENAE|nr:hypothetical protein [Lentzea aerocolonigenes]KJK52697.1 hypothetical protein UK23_03290 [Lentzea aerocolonigenes]